MVLRLSNMSHAGYLFRTCGHAGVALDGAGPLACLESTCATVTRSKACGCLPGLVRPHVRLRRFVFFCEFASASCLRDLPVQRLQTQMN